VGGFKTRNFEALGSRKGGKGGLGFHLERPKRGICNKTCHSRGRKIPVGEKEKNEMGFVTRETRFSGISSKKKTEERERCLKNKWIA